jgi:FkbM family methyltransferase
MEPSIAGINRLLKNLLFLLGECQGVRSKARFCRYAGALTLAKLSSALGSRNGQISVDDPELFLRLKHGDVWFESSPGSEELWSYIEAYSAREYDSDSIRFDAQDVILDLGANIGIFAIRYGKEFPTVPIHCFEPNPRVYKRLVRNLEANSLINAVAVNAAAAECTGVRPFFVGRNTVAGSLIEGGALSPAFNIEVIDLDTYCKAHSITSIGLLKIDVEGAEVAVLEGAQCALKSAKYVIIECHSPALESSVRTIMAGYNFEATVKRDFMYGARVLHFARPRPSALIATDGNS